MIKNYRLSTISDALGQKTTFSYSVPGDIYKVSAVTDPFGRQATFSYDANGQLVTVTDVIGMQSHFGYAERRHPRVDDDALRNNIVCSTAAYRRGAMDRSH